MNDECAICGMPWAWGDHVARTNGAGEVEHVHVDCHAPPAVAMPFGAERAATTEVRHVTADHQQVIACTASSGDPGRRTDPGASS